MKQLLICCLIALPMTIFGQNSSVANFYEKYEHYKNVTNVNLKGWVLKLAASFSDDKDTKDVLRQVTKLKVMVMENGNIVERTDVKQLLRQVRKDNFEELMNIKDGKSNVNILIKEEKNAITDLLIVVNGADDFILLSLEGWMDFSDLSKLNIEVEGGKYFKKIPSRKKDIPRA